MEYKHILLEKEGEIVTITINNPKTLNALDIPTLLELESAINAIRDDGNSKVVILTGSGEKAFIAGGDIKDLNSRKGLAHYREYAQLIHRVFNNIANLQKPVIAAVQGYALGGGTELVCACDIRVASKNAKFGVPEINLGIFPGAGGSQRLSRQIPLCRAKEMLFTGEMIDAEEAEKIGLINKAVEQPDLMKVVKEIAEKISQKSAITLELLKRTVNQGLEAPLPVALEFERAMIGLAFDSEDAHEGMSAFVEKRKPSFKGK
jgi:enoyl-CoA hydratase